MKAIFSLKDMKNKDVIQKLKKIAENYNTNLKKEDLTEGHFILAKSKLQIVQKKEDNSSTVYVWGAEQSDIDYLKNIFGQPEEIKRERLSPQEFANELISIPQVNELSKEEIKEILEINEEAFNQYKRLLKISARRGSKEDKINQAFNILNDIK